MVTMTIMAEMAVRGAVMSSTRIRDFRNRTIRRQDTFGTRTGSSLEGVSVHIESIPSEDTVSTLSEELGSTLSEEFPSALSSSG
jgi:hypothetical protein